MDFGRVLVTASSSERERAVLLVDLDEGTFTEVLPYIGGICTGGEGLYVARLEGDRTRVEKYDREGLVWMRRVRDCVDTHSITAFGDGIAVCSTGTNEVIFLDDHGAETGRWSPDERAEGDSWHINSLVADRGRLYVTCFGRFDRFRGWAGRIEGSGLLLEVGSGRAVLDGLSAPHDPRPVEGGWVLNDAARSVTVFHPEGGPPQVLYRAPGFARGLAILQDAYVVGSSSHRLSAGMGAGSSVAVVDRRSLAVLRLIRLPYLEVGHILASPPAEVVSALRREARDGCHGLSPRQGPIPEPDRAGSIEALGAPRPSADRPGLWSLPVRLTNRGGRAWSSGDEPPLSVAYQVIGRPGGPMLLEGARTRLPIPIQPGRSLTFDLHLELPAHNSGVEASIFITILQESVAWWAATERWSPLVLDWP
jgi:hypothetical protein